MKMDNKYRLEVTVGIFVIIGLLCVGYLTIRLGKLQVIGGNYYAINARFSNIGGLKVGNEVQVSGFVVGRVDAIDINPDDFSVTVKMNILKSVKLTDDSIASIKTSGLIGDKFVKISPGGSDIILEAGETIIDTMPPVDLEDLISKYVFGSVKE
jgi:phospholipid/cholesterol/gamma-HCH transport system substrate-binding protein